ncbi:22059_t:CDS:1, partial [Gigaspora rosea]
MYKCVTLILVLGDKLKISEERAEQWVFSYIGKTAAILHLALAIIIFELIINFIDLLHRFQLWCAATSVIKYCNNTAVGMLNQ